MKKFSISALVSALFMLGALISSTTTANACGRSYATACVVAAPVIKVVIVRAAPRKPRCHSRCAPKVVCHKHWRWKTIRVWDRRRCCYIYKKVRRYKTVCHKKH